MKIGQRIKRQRKKRHLTQPQLCRLTGLRSAGYLSDLETGKRGLSAITLMKLADVFGVSMDWLMRGTESKYEDGVE